MILCCICDFEIQEPLGNADVVCLECGMRYAYRESRTLILEASQISRMRADKGFIARIGEEYTVDGVKFRQSSVVNVLFGGKPAFATHFRGNVSVHCDVILEDIVNRNVLVTRKNFHFICKLKEVGPDGPDQF